MSAVDKKSYLCQNYLPMEGDALIQKTKEYEERANKLVISFETELKNIDLNELKTEAIRHLNIGNYEVVTLNILKVLATITPRDRERILERNLFCGKPHKTSGLIEYIESGKKVSPPMLEIISPGQLTIRDGFHRIALFHFLNHKQIPFLVTKSKSTLVADLK